MKKVIFYLIAIALIGCSDNGCNGSGSGLFTKKFEPVGQGIDMVNLLSKRNGRLLTDVCTVVPLEDIARILKLEPNVIEVTNSSPGGAKPKHSSCFFKWDDFDIPNAGILFQALRNPVSDDEFPNYAQVFIESKRTSGEQGIGSEPIIFKKLEGLGDDGAYSVEAGKYFWRLGEDIIFSIAFNTPHTSEQQFSIARDLGALITKNYIQGK